MKRRHNVLELAPERGSPVDELLSPGSEPLSRCPKCCG